MKFNNGIRICFKAEIKQRIIICKRHDSCYDDAKKERHPSIKKSTKIQYIFY